MGSDNMKDDFALRLERLRKEKGYTQDAVGASIGLKGSTYSAYETSKNRPTLDTVMRLADLYHVSIDYLLGRTQERKPATDELAKRLNVLAFLCKDTDAQAVSYEEVLLLINSLIDYYHTRQRAGDEPVACVHAVLDALTRTVQAASGDSFSALHLASNDLAIAALNASKIITAYTK